MECPSCGHSNRDDARFCGGCGAELLAPLACPRCETQNPRGRSFCDACGFDLRMGASEPLGPEALPKDFGAGRYRVRRVLGEGAKKRVYLALDTKLDREVAVSLIKAEGLDEGTRAQVRREAEAMARLGDHPNIVTIYDVAEESGEIYIVSQFIEGGDLERRLHEAPDHRVPIDDALGIIEQIGRALGHAHARNIIHRDLKPANVWLTEDGTAKLGDFGLALSLAPSDSGQEAAIVGTAAYMSPEQALGRRAEPSSDLYSLGAMLYEMVTGRPPFIAQDPASLLAQHINSPPEEPSRYNPDVSDALGALIQRLLAKRPKGRPASAAEACEAIRALASRPAAVGPAPVNPLALPEDVFVGRSTELRQLRSALDEAISGRGRLFMLVGEGGIGKTRTAEELCKYARRRNVEVLLGRCYESAGAPAYWPWVQIVRSHAQARDAAELESEMGPGAADIAKMVPEVRQRLPDLPVPLALEPEQERFRLFQSLSTFLRNASASRPLLLVLDDLHWADMSSLLLLQFLAREIHGMRLLVVGAYRDVEVQRGHPLADALAELRRERAYERMLLRGLPEEDVRAMLVRLGGQDVPEAFAQAIFRETEGNPFFVEEVLRHLLEEGVVYRRGDHWTSDRAPDQMGIPEGVREVIGRRLSRLSERCSATLTLASVVGREFPLGALARVAELEETDLLDLLDEAMGARIVEQMPGSLGRYRFSHALIRETLYDELSTPRRVRLHRSIAELLEAFYESDPEPHLDELAHHFFEAAQGGDGDQAVAYARRAAKHAMDQLAYEKAAAHYEHLLRALEFNKEVREEERAEILLAQGWARRFAGQDEAARDSFQRAARLARKLGSSEVLASAALGVAPSFESITVGIFNRDIVGLLEEALDTLPKQDSKLRAALLGALAMVLYWGGSHERRELLSREAVEMARRLGDPAALGHALNSRHVAIWSAGNPEERLVIAKEMLELGETAGDKELSMMAGAWCVADSLELGDIGACDAHIRAQAKLSEELRQPRYTTYSAWCRVMRALLEGPFDDALETLIRSVFEQVRGVQEPNALQAFSVQMVGLRREQGRIGELEAGFKNFVERFPEVPTWSFALAWLYAEDGRLDESRRQIERVVARDLDSVPRDMFWLTGSVLLGVACAVVGDVARASDLYRRLKPCAPHFVVVGHSTLYTFGPVSHYLGILATALGRWSDAARHFENAIAACERVGTSPHRARAQVEYARMLIARDDPGDRDRALERLSQALDTARDLSMKAVLDTAVSLKLQILGLDSVDSKQSIYAVASRVHERQPDLSSQAAPDGTVTLMFSDIHNSTEMIERLGDLAAHEVIQAHNAIVREQAAIFGGYEVELRGDGFLLAFSSARQAVLSAIAIHRELAAYSEQHPSQPLRVRIGMHTGEALKDADKFFGKMVVQAFRIADAAQPGQILVSSVVKDLTESAGDLRFDAGREVQLKGLAASHRLYGVEWS